MFSALTAIRFLATVVILFALVYAFTSVETGVAERLEQLKKPTVRAPEAKFAERHKEKARALLAKVGTLLPVAAGARATRGQIMMLRAGYRGAEAALVIQGMRILTPIVLVIILLVTGVYRSNPFFILLFALIL